MLGGKFRQKHSHQCRARMAEALAGSKRVEEAKERKRKYVEEALEAEERDQRTKAEERISKTEAAESDRMEEEMKGDELEAKRTRLEEIEAEVMDTEDFGKLEKLYTEYMQVTEELRGKRRAVRGGDEDPDEKRTRGEEPGGSSSSTDVVLNYLGR